jgi:hypothetical protein
MTSGQDVKVEHLHHAGHLQVLAGDLTAAEGTLKRLAAISKERPNAFTRSCTIQLQAGIAALRGRDAQAADLLKEADAAYPSYHAHVGLAELAEKRSDWRAAAEEWRQVAGPAATFCVMDSPRTSCSRGCNWPGRAPGWE